MAKVTSRSSKEAMWEEVKRLTALVTDREAGDTVPKAKVVSVAREYAQRHGMCDVVNDALKDMGIQTDEAVEITLKIRFEAEPQYEYTGDMSIGEYLSQDRTELAETILNRLNGTNGYSGLHTYDSFDLDTDNIEVEVVSVTSKTA